MNSIVYKVYLGKANPDNLVKNKTNTDKPNIMIKGNTVGLEDCVRELLWDLWPLWEQCGCLPLSPAPCCALASWAIKVLPIVPKPLVPAGSWWPLCSAHTGLLIVHQTHTTCWALCCSSHCPEGSSPGLCSSQCLNKDFTSYPNSWHASCSLSRFYTPFLVSCLYFSFGFTKLLHAGFSFPLFEIGHSL